MNLILIASIVVIIIVIILIILFLRNIIKNKESVLLNYKENISLNSRKKDNFSKPKIKKLRKNKLNKNIKELNKLEDNIELVNNQKKKNVVNQNSNKDIQKRDKTVITKSDIKGSIKINNLEDILTYSKNESLVNIIKMLNEQGYLIIKDRLLKKEFDTISELLKYIKEEIHSSLNPEYEDIKQNLSILRKQGKDVNELNFEAMRIPFKIKIFKATFKEKDFNNVFNLIMEIKTEIKKIEQEISTEKIIETNKDNQPVEKI
jgi:hypothetical protein